MNVSIMFIIILLTAAVELVVTQTRKISRDTEERINKLSETTKKMVFVTKIIFIHVFINYTHVFTTYGSINLYILFIFIFMHSTCLSM
jgi:hypothetical protein